MKPIAIIVLILFSLNPCSPHNDKVGQAEAAPTPYQSSGDEVYENTKAPLSVSENTLSQDQHKGTLTIINEWHNLYYSYLDNEEFLLNIYRENNQYSRRIHSKLR